MTTRALILSPHEVRAALRGELGLIVRPVMPQPEYQDDTGRWTYCVSSTDKTSRDKWTYCVIDPASHHYTERGRERCVLSLRDPFGVPGTRLVCKETWCQHWQPDTGYLQEALYRADGIVFENQEEDGSPWKAATCMPAWASRITLVNETVGVARVQDLTDEDILGCGFALCLSDDLGVEKMRNAFKKRWDARYAAKGLGWDSSPWVWKCEVRRTGG